MLNNQTIVSVSCQKLIRLLSERGREEDFQLSKPMYWILWVFALIMVNAFVIPLAFFTSSEESASQDFMLALFVLLMCNVVTIQLFLAAMRKNQNGFSKGLIFAGVFVLGMFLIWQNVIVRFAVLLVVVSIVAAAILFVIELFEMMRGKRDV